MNHYKKIAIWENRKRAKLLIEFRDLVVTYFNNLKHSDFGFKVHENEEAKQVRIKINMGLYKIHSAMILAGVNPTIYYSPPPAIGRLAGNIDLINNIFNLHRFQIGSQELLDVIERAIGIYENDRLNALFRTVNPLFGISLILDYIVSLPFKVIGKMGFNQKKIESSITGRVIKSTLYLIMVLAAFLTVLEKIDYLEKFISLIQGWIK